MTEQLKQQLRELKLSGIRDALERQHQQPGHYQELGFEERLSLLLEQELTDRSQRRIERLIKQARFRLQANLEQLDYRSDRGLHRAQIRSLAEDTGLAWGRL